MICFSGCISTHPKHCIKNKYGMVNHFKKHRNMKKISMDPKNDGLENDISPCPLERETVSSAHGLLFVQPAPRYLL